MVSPRNSNRKAEQASGGVQIGGGLFTSKRAITMVGRIVPLLLVGIPLVLLPSPLFAQARMARTYASSGPATNSSQKHALRKVVHAANYPGTDWCAKVTAAQAALSGGGTVDATGLDGPQSCAKGLAVRQHVKVIIGYAKVTLSRGSTIALNSYSSLVGQGVRRSMVSGNVSGHGVVQLKPGYYEHIFDLTISNSDSTHVGSSDITSDASLAIGKNLFLNGGYYNLYLYGGYYGSWTNIYTGNAGGKTVHTNVLLGSPTSAANDTLISNLVAGAGTYACLDNANSEAVTVVDFDCENGTGVTQTAIATEIQRGGAPPDTKILGGYIQIGANRGRNYCITNNGGTVEVDGVWFQQCTGSTGRSPRGWGGNLIVGNAVHMRTGGNGSTVGISVNEGKLRVQNFGTFPGIVLLPKAPNLPLDISQIGPDALTLRDANNSQRFLLDVYGSEHLHNSLAVRGRASVGGILSLRSPLSLKSYPFAKLPAASNGDLVYCSNCKNAADDGAAFDSAATPGGHGTMLLHENGRWRVH